MMPHWSGVFAVTTLLLCSPFVACHSKPITESSLRWAEKLAIDPSNPTRCIEDMRCGPSNAEDAFQWLLVKYGPNAESYNGVARSRMQLGNYTGAQMAYERSLALSPGNPTVAQELQTCLTLVHVAEQITPMLPEGHSLLRVCPVPGQDQASYWVALSARVEQKDNGYSHITLTMVKVTAGFYTKQTQILLPGFYYREIDNDGYSGVQLCVIDITCDGIPEVVIHANYSGGSWSPSHLLIYRWQSNQLVKLLGVSSDEPLSVTDLGHDGRYEIINKHAVGWLMCHAAQPRWTNIYAYKNGTYQLANGDYPLEFTELQMDIQEQLREFPHDPELLQYLGSTYEIQKRPRLALQAYRKAIRYYTKAAKSDNDPTGRAEILAIINTIRQRIQALTVR